jgi:hypothetical protein
MPTERGSGKGKSDSVACLGGGHVPPTKRENLADHRQYAAQGQGSRMSGRTR